MPGSIFLTIIWKCTNKPRKKTSVYQENPQDNFQTYQVKMVLLIRLPQYYLVIYATNHIIYRYCQVISPKYQYYSSMVFPNSDKYFLLHLLSNSWSLYLLFYLEKPYFLGYNRKIQGRTIIPGYLYPKSISRSLYYYKSNTFFQCNTFYQLIMILF